MFDAFHLLPPEILSKMVSFTRAQDAVNLSQASKNISQLFSLVPLQQKKKKGILHCHAGNNYTFLETFFYGRRVLFAAGKNDSGQLGGGDELQYRQFTQVKLPTELNAIVSVYYGEDFTFVLGRDKEQNPLLAACGKNHGQLGFYDLQSRKEFTLVPLPVNMDEVNSLIVMENAVFLIGSNCTSVLLAGCGSIFKEPGFQLMKLPLGMVQIERMFFGEYNVFLLSQSSSQAPLVATLDCNELNKKQLIPIELPLDFHSVSKIYPGKKHSFMVGADKNGKLLLAAWGANDWGQLGLGDCDNRGQFTLVPLPTDVDIIENIQLFEEHSIIIAGKKDKRYLLACGDNLSGRYGAGEAWIINAFSELKLPSNLKEISQMLFLDNSKYLIGVDQEQRPLLAVCGCDTMALGVGKETVSVKQFTLVDLPASVAKINAIYAKHMRAFLVCQDATNNLLLLATGKNEYGETGLNNGRINSKEFIQVMLTAEIAEIHDIQMDKETTFIVGTTKENKPVLAACGTNKGYQLGREYQLSQEQFVILKNVSLPRPDISFFAPPPEETLPSLLREEKPSLF